MAPGIARCILRHVSRPPRIPPALKLLPFSLEEAREAGLTLRALSRNTWKRIGSRLYQWSDLPDDPWLTLSAWRRILPPQAVFIGASAAWLFGLDIQAIHPVEVMVPVSSAIRTRAGLLVRHGEIPPEEVVCMRELRATILPRTLAELCLRRSAVEALVAIDMAIHRGLVDATSLVRWAETVERRPGAARMKSLASWGEPAESPMETRLRWLLIQAGLPRPEVQAIVRDGSNRFAGRVDLYYRDARLVLEYDGANHRERLVEDDRRQNGIVNSEHRVLRFTAADIYHRPDVVVDLVRGALMRAPKRQCRRG